MEMTIRSTSDNNLAIVGLEFWQMRNLPRISLSWAKTTSKIGSAHPQVRHTSRQGDLIQNAHFGFQITQKFKHKQYMSNCEVLRTEINA